MKLLKYRIFFFLFISFFYGNIFSQKSLNTTTVNELIELKKNISDSVEKNDSLSMARAYYKLALKYDYLDLNDSCEFYYKKALVIAKNIKNVRAYAIISNALATTYSERGLHQKAISVYSEIIESFFSLKDTSAASGVLLNIGGEYFDIGEYQKGLENSINALKLKLSTKDSSNIAGYYQQIGGIFNSVGNKEKWKEYILLANKLAKQNPKYGDFYRRMDILNELGGYYLSIGDYKTARNYYDTLYTKSMEKDYSVGVVSSISKLVSILKQEKNYKDALKYSKEALALSKKTERIYKIIYNSIETAKLEIILSQKSRAEKRLKETEVLAKKYNFPSELISVYKILAELNYDKGRYKTAYNYLNNFQILKDSIEGAKTQQKIAELETKFQTEKKDNEIKILNKENLIKEKKIELQNKTLIGFVVLGILVISLFLLIYTQRKLKDKNRILNLNQKLLRTQMNPHFIFNALIAIQNYILKNKKFEASDFLSKFASLMRIILNSSRKDFCTLKNEIEMLEYYVSLQQLRFENSFQFNLKIDEDINTEEISIPPMLIQPFIENAIEHGLRKITEGEKILSVQYLMENNFLKIIVEDNGIGIDKSLSDNSLKKHRSYAMEITEERLTNITKLFNEKIDISIYDLSVLGNGQGTRVQFLIPEKLIKGKNND